MANALSWAQFARQINLGTVVQVSQETSEPSMPLPTPENLGELQQYWAAQGWPWRREPEISQARQEELAQRRMIQVDIERGIYPFGGMTLTRADIEWLLVTHDDGRGPVGWSDEQQRAREGVDLRGASVAEGTNLSALPLARLRGGFSSEEDHLLVTKDQRNQAPICLQGVFLSAAHLEGADLGGANLEGADLRSANLKGVCLVRANLERADLRSANLERTKLWDANLEGANLWKTNLEGADLGGANLEGANLWETNLEGADLRGVFFSHVKLFNVVFAEAHGVSPLLADIQWGETNLTVVDWSRVRMLRDEDLARQRVTAEKKKKDRATRLREYQDAHRATHQLATVLQGQGLIEDASRFAYRAKCLKRTELWHGLLLTKTTKQRVQIGWSLLFSWALFLLAGYGYRLRLCLFWYIGIVLAFTLLYWLSDPAHLPWWAALGESVNVFHGRGAAPTIAALAHPVYFTLLTVAEAMIGFVIEVVFVATMVQRLFGK